MKWVFIFLLGTITSYGQLNVTVSPPKMGSQKAVVPLTLKNSFPEKIESVRAVVFLLDEQGKMVGQGTRWIVGGGKDRPALESKKDTVFNFVVSTDRPFTTTNLTAKVSVSRVVLDSGKLADPSKDVQIQNGGK